MPVLQIAMSALRVLGEEDAMAYQLCESAKSTSAAVRLRTIELMDWAIRDSRFNPDCVIEVLTEAIYYEGNIGGCDPIVAGPNLHYAVTVLASLGTTAIGPLTEFLKYPQVCLVEEACNALAKFGPCASLAVAPLVALLRSDQTVNWYQAAATLGAIGPYAAAAVPTLVSVLENNPTFDEVVSTLGCIGPAAAAAVPILVRLLHPSRGDDEFHEAVGWALREIGFDAIAQHRTEACEIAPSLIDQLLNYGSYYAIYEPLYEASLAVCRVCIERFIPRLLADISSGSPKSYHAEIILQDIGADAISAVLAWAALSEEHANRETAVAFALSLGDDSRPALLLAKSASNPAISDFAGQIIETMDAAVRTAEYEEYLVEREAARIGSPPFERILTEEDKRLLGWFKGVDMNYYLPRLQVFWCIGRLDWAAVKSVSRALGSASLRLAFRKHEPRFKRVLLPCGANYLNETVDDVDGLFDNPPFNPEAWTDLERSMPLKRPAENKRKDQWWTVKAQKAWEYVDRYLALIDAIPVMNDTQEGASQR
jgi:hypothetical protein